MGSGDFKNTHLKWIITTFICFVFVGFLYLPKAQAETVATDDTVEADTEIDTDIESASEDYSKELTVVKKWNLLVSQGYKLAGEDSSAQAAEAFELALELQVTKEEESKLVPERKVVRLAYYYALKVSGQHEKALPVLEVLVSDNPEDENFLRELGFLYLSIGEQEDNQSYRQLIGSEKRILNIDDGEYQRADDSEQSVADTEAEKSENLEYIAAQLEMYNSLRESGRFSQALTVLEELAEEFPDNEEIGKELRSVYSSGGKALSTFDELCQSEPVSRDDCMQTVYIYIKLEDNESAIDVLEYVLESYPKDNVARKELAYLLLKVDRKPEAVEQFEVLESQTPNDLGVRTELVYIYLEDDRKTDALNEINYILDKEPKHHQLRLELGYLLWELDKKDESEEQFEIVADQKEDQESSEKATDMLNSIRGVPEDGSLFFGDLYLHLFFTARNPNLIFTGRVREGINIPKIPVRVYLSLRLTRDLNSDGILGNGIYEDNFAIPAAGIEINPLGNRVPELGFTFFFEVGPAFALYDRPAGQIELDMRGGVTLSYRWQHFKAVENPDGQWIWPGTFFGEFYTDFIWFYRYDNNWIGYLNVKEGLNLFQYGKLLDQIYLRFNLGYDVDGIYYNNFAELGAGMRVMPWHWLNLQFYAEYLFGMYIPRTNSNNPNDTVYHDGRIGILFFYNW